MAALWDHARLVIDLLSIKLLVWTLGQCGELLDSHLFFYHRYAALADFHRQRGRITRANRLAAIAEAHYQAAPDDDDPPEAAAMASSRPLPVLRTHAVSGATLPEPARPRSVRAPRGSRADAFENGSNPHPSVV